MLLNSGLATLGDLVETSASRWAGRIALTYGGRGFSFGEQRSRVYRLANALYDMGVRRQQRVAILAQNSNAYVEVYAAGEVAGFITVAINYRLAASEIEYIIKDSVPTVFIFDEEYAEIARDIRAKYPELSRHIVIGSGQIDGAENYESLLSKSSDQTPKTRSRPTDIAYLIYTSGTTGRPKGAMLDHAGQLGFIEMQAAEMSARSTDTMLLVMPFYHIGAKCNYLMNQFAGGRVILHRSYDIRAISSDIQREKVTTIHLAPVMVKDLLDLPGFDKSHYESLRLIQYASGPMAVAQLRLAIAAFGPILAQIYGMTESGLGTILHPHQHVLDGPPEWVRRLGSAGQEAHGYRVRVVRPDGSDCEPEEQGEIWVKGPGVMAGYWNNHPATLDAIEDGWMKSGDIGAFDKDRFLFVLDRKKDMILSGGENIYPREVEEALYGHPAVAEAAVIGVPDSRWGESVKAFVVVAPGQIANEGDLIEHCRQHIASYKKPKSVEFVDALPRLPNKKIDKKQLRAPYWDGLTRQVN
ncbi:MAG: long-chain-fatty-acid--CoA ligase [Hyphomicrobiales bacterium]|nr:long-chain-fatty-acid--CoA ligase [Alphaproteobacteria bacterium]